MQLRPLSPNRDLHGTSHFGKTGISAIRACQKTRLAFGGSEDIVWSYLVILLSSSYQLLIHLVASITETPQVTGKSITCNSKPSRVPCYRKHPATANPAKLRWLLCCVRITRPTQLIRTSLAPGSKAGSITSTCTSASSGGYLVLSTNNPPHPMLAQHPTSRYSSSSLHRKSAGTASWNRRNALRPVEGFTGSVPVIWRDESP